MAEAFISNYKVFMNQVVETVNEAKEKASKVKDNKFLDIQIKNLELQANSYCLFVRDEVKKDSEFNKALAYEWKSAANAIDFINSKAKELYVAGQPVMVPDAVVYGWLKEYYALDDKEEYYKKKAEEEERARLAAEKKAKAEEAARKKQEKYEKIMAKPEDKRTKTDLEFLKKYTPVKRIKTEEDEEENDEEMDESYESENDESDKAIESAEETSAEVVNFASSTEPAVDDDFWNSINFDQQGQASFLSA